MVFRILRDGDPSKWDPTRRYIYSKNTSTSSLCPHIKKYHLDLFKTLAQERGWKVLLPGLVTQAKSQASAAVATNQRVPDKFNEDSFRQYLVNFIIVDDQVWFSVFKVNARHIYFVYLVIERCRMSGIQGTLTSSPERFEDPTPHQVA